MKKSGFLATESGGWEHRTPSIDTLLLLGLRMTMITLQYASHCSNTAVNGVVCNYTSPANSLIYTGSSVSDLNVDANSVRC